MSYELGHRERVMRSLNSQDIDKVAMFFRADSDVQEHLKRQFSFSNEEDMLRHYDSDAIQLFLPCFDYKLPDLKQAETVDDVMQADWPDRSVLNLEAAVKQAQHARNTGMAVYGGVWASIFTGSRHMVGEEHYLMAMALEPEFVHAVVSRLTDFFLDVNKAYLDVCSKNIDIYYFGSDFGTQLSMFVSPDMYRAFYKPQMKRIVDQAKEYGLMVMFHTCGAIGEIIPDLIEIGIDILDPVQVSAKNMDPETLSANHKGRICFHGGISTQSTLPFGTVDLVRDEVNRTIELLGPMRLIVAPDQHMIGEIPLENIDALFKTVREYKIS